jgi:Holliday junction resolvase RusA-like endonuclease
MSKKFSFTAFGDPRPAGSKQAFRTKTGKMVVVDTSGSSGYRWRMAIRDAALAALDREPESLPLFPAEPLKVTMTFRFERPKGHYNKHGGLRKSAPYYHIVRPDALKLARAVEDALTGIVWRDDSQIVCENLTKTYIDAENGWYPGVKVEVEAIL